jgi:Glycosyl transferases group 1
MSAGVVPVASDLPCGIRDIVDHGRTGFLPRPGDVAAFAAAIGAALSDRARFEEMSGAARDAVAERFDARRRAADFESLFAQWPRLLRPRPERVALRYGSRLDQPWLPNALVKTLRAVRGVHQPAQAR